MIENEKLRRADFVTSIILVLFGLFILSQALQMPMKDTYGGVTNVWYVSPALMPMIVSVVILGIAILLLVNSVRTGGARYFFESASRYKFGVSDAGFRFLATLLAIVSFVYVYIPRVDFFLDIILFLLYFVSVFYLDDMVLLKKISVFYLIGTIVMLAIAVFGLDTSLKKLFSYTVDILVLLFIVGLWAFERVSVGTDPVLRRKVRITLILSIAVPLALCPIFKYGLLVPLPYEGGILKLMDLIRYSVFGR
ncbi:MAG TPA: hypothetical protein VMW87_15865 [Spirochaetia bacterium]|nr:hypothetical protein [Spirochaetia bacterium]